MTGWGYSASLLRARENALLDSNLLQKWSEAQNIETFLKYVKDSPYGEVFNETNIAEYERFFEENVNTLYRELSIICPDDELVKLAVMQYDINNAKMLIKAELNQIAMKWESLSDFGHYQSEEIYFLIHERLYFKFPPVIARAMVESEEEYKRTSNSQVVDFLVDTAFWAYQFEVLSANPAYRKILDYYKIWADLENIKNIVRAKRLSMDRPLFLMTVIMGGTIHGDVFKTLYNESLGGILEFVIKSYYGSVLEAGLKDIEENLGFSRLEKSIDEYLIRKALDFRFVSSGPEVIIEYLLLKKLEIKNLKILFIGKINDIAPEAIKTRMREVRV